MYHPTILVGIFFRAQILSKMLGFNPSMKYLMRAMPLIIPDCPARIQNWDTYSSVDPVCLRFQSPAHAFPATSEGKKASLRAVVVMNRGTLFLSHPLSHRLHEAHLKLLFFSHAQLLFL